MRKQIGLMFILFFTNSICLADSDSITTHFMSPAHMMMGNDVVLRFASEEIGLTAAPLYLSSTTNMTYGEILVMPDFYGSMPNYYTVDPISAGKTAAERRQRFQNAFDQFMHSPAEAKAIISLAMEEHARVLEGMEADKTPEEVYQQIGDEFDRRNNCLTGGGCAAKGWWMLPGRYMYVTLNNFDHFGDSAIIAYQTGHQLALEQAALANQTRDAQLLDRAYAMNAFACHFLSDRFAAGHIRVPREKLTNAAGTWVGGFLSGIMHDEENQAGLHVHNQRGDHWIAYGDKSWFNPKDDANKEMVHQALQASADAIFAAYEQGTVNVPDPVMELIPWPDEPDLHGNVDISPLFYWDSSQLLRRVDIYDTHDRHWMNNWWVYTTAIALLAKHNNEASFAAVAGEALDDLSLSGMEKAMLWQSPEMRKEAKKRGIDFNKLQ